jgi:hypothetical protein
MDLLLFPPSLLAGEKHLSVIFRNGTDRMTLGRRQFIVGMKASGEAASRRPARLPIGQRLQPDAQGHASTLGGGLVPLPLAGRHPDVYTHAGGVFQGGSTPRSFGLGHGLIMYSQIILDKPPVRVLNVLTLNKEAKSKTKPSSQHLCAWCKQMRDEHRYMDEACPLKSLEWSEKRKYKERAA